MSTEDGEWLELAAPAEPEAVEAVAAAFAEWGQGVAIEQPVESSRDGDVVSIPLDAPVLVKTYLPLADPALDQRRAQLEKAVWALGQLRQVGPLRVRHLREEDWANAWKEYFFIHRVGRRSVIVPSWREGEYAPQADDLVLLLDPGMAFGTGLHPTTRLCLTALEDQVQPGMRVLDFGAGSGILAIAAARLGADHVDALEIDPVAAAVCRQNVERNDVADRISVVNGSLEASPEPYDVAAANLTIRILLEVQETLLLRMAAGGLAIFSGVLAERADDLRSALEAIGWEHVETRQEQDWIALLARARR